MNAIALGVAMLVYATGATPALEMSRPTLVPAAFTFDLPDAATTPHNLPHPFLNEQSRPVWRHGSLPPAPATTARRPEKTVRIIAVAAVGFGGFLAGGWIGCAIAQKPRDDDGASCLRGVGIGAPIGAVAGTVVGYWLTK